MQKKKFTNKSLNHRHIIQILSKTFKRLAIGIVLWQFVDVILHIALGLPEPLRIAASIVIVGWLGATLADKLTEKFQPIALGAIGAYALLNIIFLFTQNILTTQEVAFMLVVFVTPTVGLSGWLTKEKIGEK